MTPNPILRVRRLALAAQVAAGGPARTGQLIRAGLLVPAADVAESGERRPSPLLPMPPGGGDVGRHNRSRIATCDDEVLPAIAAGVIAASSEPVRTAVTQPGTPRRDSAAIETRSKEPEPSAGPLVAAFAAATGRRTPPAAWFIARGTRPARDASQTRAHGAAGVAAGPLRGTQGQG